MSSLDVQLILAQLYTDEAALGEFLADRDSFCRSLAEKDRELLRQIDRRQLEFFAESLKSKRAREAENLLPMTRAAAGDSFHKEFRRYTRGAIAGGEKKHVADAMAFCKHLMKSSSADALTREAARFEAACFEMNFKLSREGSNPAVYLAKPRRMPRFLLKRMAYDLPALTARSDLRQEARRRTTVVLLANLPGLRGVWYW